MLLVANLTDKALLKWTNFSKEDRAFCSGMMAVITAATIIESANSFVNPIGIKIAGASYSVLAGLITAVVQTSSEEKPFLVQLESDATPHSLLAGAVVAAAGTAFFGSETGALLGAAATNVVFRKIDSLPSPRANGVNIGQRIPR